MDISVKGDEDSTYALQELLEDEGYKWLGGNNKSKWATHLYITTNPVGSLSKSFTCHSHHFKDDKVINDIFTEHRKLENLLGIPYLAEKLIHYEVRDEKN